MPGKRIIFGFGNYLKGDDGIGLEVVNYINNHIKLEYEELRAINIGNDGLLMLTYFEENLSKILIIDCAMIGIEAGDYRIFNFSEVKTKKENLNISTHESDVIKLIELGISIGYRIPDIMLMGIQPFSVKDSNNISDLLKDKIKNYAEIALNEIKR